MTTHRTGAREEAWPYRRSAAGGVEYRMRQGPGGKWVITRDGTRVMTEAKLDKATRLTDWCILNDGAVRQAVESDDIEALVSLTERARTGALLEGKVRRDIRPAVAGNPEYHVIRQVMTSASGAATRIEIGLERLAENPSSIHADTHDLVARLLQIKLDLDKLQADATAAARVTTHT